MRRRNIIIGLDGVPYRLLKDLAEKGIMPNTQSLVKDGCFKKMESSIPEVSSVAWSSIITGKNPAEHGIFGFTDFPFGTYRLSFPNFNSLKTPPFWERDNLNRHVIVNVPATYPAREMNGILISGFVAPEFEKAVYPDSVIPFLKKMDYRIDAEPERAHESLDFFLKDLERVNDARISAYRHLWDENWKTFMFVFTGTDRLMHFLWDAYEDTTHRFHKRFRDYFRRIDGVIGEILSRVTDDDGVIMLSDHGFEKLEYDVYINAILEKEGFLKLKHAGGASHIGHDSIDYGTLAFALDPARIYLNLKGRYPKGCLSHKDKGHVIEELRDLFNGIEFNKKKVIKRVYTKEEIYKGAYVDQAPEMVLVGNEGFNLKSALTSQDIYSKGIFTGKHTQHDAFLLVSGNTKCDMVPECPSVCDVTNIISQM